MLTEVGTFIASLACYHKHTLSKHVSDFTNNDKNHITGTLDSLCNKFKMSEIVTPFYQRCALYTVFQQTFFLHNIRFRYYGILKKIYNRAVWN